MRPLGNVTCISTSPTDGLNLSQTPFCHCELPDFLEDNKLLDELQTELVDLDFTQKNNDLYKFLQVVLFILIIEPF